MPGSLSTFWPTVLVTFGSLRTDYGESVDDLSHVILRDAEQERVKAESHYTVWTVAMYAFYGLGWLIGVIGILMEVEEEKNVEAIVEET